LQVTCLLKDWYPKHTKRALQTQQENSSVFKMGKILIRHLSKEDIRIANKHMKNGQNHVIGKLLIRATVRNNYTPVRVTDTQPRTLTVPNAGQELSLTAGGRQPLSKRSYCLNHSASPCVRNF
jgi:hypothetical protein